MTQALPSPTLRPLAAILLAAALGCASTASTQEAAEAATPSAPDYTCTVIARAGQRAEELGRDTFQITAEMIGQNTAVNTCLALVYRRPPPGATAFECSCEALAQAD